MKKLAIAAALLFQTFIAISQVTYIGIINHNIGTGSNNLFNNYVAVGQHCYIDWEVYAEGMNNAETCGTGSVSRLVLRRTGSGDPTSVVASAPIIVPGICGGKSGNNDHYYADLSTYIDKAGRYSVEVQADLPGQPDAFGNATTKTTNNYSCPSAYYLTGTGGPTGNYYTPSGTCAGGPGLSDPVGGPAADRLEEIFPALKFFTVGEAGTYREMIVLNGHFYDTEQGKFQPGNPALPPSLDGAEGIPAGGICPLGAVPPISIGGEINDFKRTDCSADVTGAAVFYRLYKEGETAPAFGSFSLAFKDDCSSSPNGPEGNIFPMGGSCQNGNNILDQRWQTINAVNNIMPDSFALSDTGRWKIELYTETYAKNCAGADTVLQGGVNTITFTVASPFSPGSPCSALPVILSKFTVSPSVQGNLLLWTVEEASQVTYFEMQQSDDGYTFSSIGKVMYSNTKSTFNFTDIAYPGKTVFYRLIVHELDGGKLYSSIVRVNNKAGGAAVSIHPAAQNITARLENFSKGKYQLDIYNTAGSLMAKSFIAMDNSNASTTLVLKNELAHGIYYAVIRDESGNMVAKNSFYY